MKQQVDLRELSQRMQSTPDKDSVDIGYVDSGSFQRMADAAEQQAKHLDLIATVLVFLVVAVIVFGVLVIKILVQ